MTNKEAISILERMQEPEAWEPQISEKMFTALQMGIDALDKDANATVTDCISRQQALALEKELMVNERGYEKYNHGLNSYRTRLMSLPSAEPDVIHCEDCRYRKYDALFDQSWCGYLWGRRVVDTDYCSRAERKCDGKNQSDL